MPETYARTVLKKQVFILDWAKHSEKPREVKWACVQLYLFRCLGYC